MAPATEWAAEDDVLVSGASPVRLDVVPLPNRSWVRVVNPDPLLKVFIGHSVAMTNTSNCEFVDPANGVWDDKLDASIPIYALSETGTPITVRVKQIAF